jgi:hypothetical protein
MISDITYNHNKILRPKDVMIIASACLMRSSPFPVHFNTLRTEMSQKKANLCESRAFLVLMPSQNDFSSSQLYTLFVKFNDPTNRIK